MSKYLMTVVGVAAMALAAGIILAAETGGATPTTPPAKADVARPHGGWWADKLGLTPDQRDQVKAIMTTAREQAASAPDHAAKVKIFKDAFEKVKTTVLTDAQRTKLAELRASPAGRMRGRAHFVGEKLCLTPEQRDAAKAILKTAHEDAAKVVDKAAKVKIFKDAFEKIRTTVLTDAQRQKLADLREKMKERHMHMKPAPTTPAAPAAPAAKAAPAATT
jgi:Spy/CpxP family protein refolding chaperone